MSAFIGEYDCTLDVKGRFMLPSGIRKQLLPQANEHFVVNRGFEECLVLYPFNEWDGIIKEVNELNLYVKRNRNFVRRFYNGATELSLDAAGRLLLPKRLMSYAGLQKEIVLFAYGNRIEIWSVKKYEELMSDDADGSFGDLAEKVMGVKKDENELS